ncbi:DNA repair protein [Corynebacterium phocae]|uniref:DNA repair protein n=1 Tax=Corynebacterium phocae TaxID=161895 RepID=A0A1L7D0G6_9CORY|nr:alpha-ketoglutarate-dependent dioxygenase AlkB [Corynebacterium phocae]APT91639.1 DNA repair protein [Corynebacterium phocae]KAA8720720.1 alpha-ketoglutarate-dependent dioxygenase AlkB [Corynebacterium phocae]
MLFFTPPRSPAKIAPGVAHLPGWLGLDQQRQLVEEMRDLAAKYAGTPMAMYRPKLKSGWMSVHQFHLGRYWDYRNYRYQDVIDGVRVPPMTESLTSLAGTALAAARRIAPELDSHLIPEMALINYYPPGAAMGMHLDDFEEANKPVISLSIGDEAIFRMGNTENRNKPWRDVLVASGDLVVFGGPARYAYHGIVKVTPGTLPEGCGLDQGRINITIRQVKK